MRDAALPITLIIVGVIWLLWYQGWLPDKDWVIAIGFITAGLAVLVLDGLTKNSVVMGPFRHRVDHPRPLPHQLRADRPRNAGDSRRVDVDCAQPVDSATPYARRQIILTRAASRSSRPACGSPAIARG